MGETLSHLKAQVFLRDLHRNMLSCNFSTH
jgi:hypothetical protein